MEKLDVEDESSRQELVVGGCRGSLRLLKNGMAKWQWQCLGKRIDKIDG
jgi:hypothetical protein